MKSLSILFFYLFATALVSQEALVSPEEKKNYSAVYFDFRVGFNVGGVGSHLKHEMEDLGMYGSNVGLFDVDYPRKSVAPAINLSAEYRRKYLGFGLEAGISEVGTAKGLAYSTVDTFIFWDYTDREFLRLYHRVGSISPFMRAYADKVVFQVGPALNWWQVRDDDSQVSKGIAVGGHLGMGIILLDNDLARIELNAIYR
jgi:hypothetical protein